MYLVQQLCSCTKLEYYWGGGGGGLWGLGAYAPAQPTKSMSQKAGY